MPIINACASPENWLASWQALSAIGIIVSWLVVALAYMVGSLLDNVGLMARAKSEVWEIITTILILASIIVIVQAACTFPASYINPGAASGANLFVTAENYLFWLRNYSLSVFSSLMGMNSFISFLISMMGGFNIFGIGLTAQPFAGFQPLVNIINLFMNGIMMCIIAAIAQITVLKFIEAGVLSILLPAGVVCRSFPFTRQFGSALIAIALGLFIIYPLMLVVDDAIMGSKSRNPNDVGREDYSLFDSLKDQLPGAIAGMFLSGGFFAPQAIEQILEALMNYFINGPIVGIGQVALAAFILPAINGVIFVAAVRDLSKLLGQEVDVSSLSRIV